MRWLLPQGILAPALPEPRLRAPRLQVCTPAHAPRKPVPCVECRGVQVKESETM